MTAVKGESVPGFSSLQDQFAAIPPENLPEIESSVDIDHEFTNIIKSGKTLLLYIRSTPLFIKVSFFDQKS